MMTNALRSAFLLSSSALLLASCGAVANGENSPDAAASSADVENGKPFNVAEVGTYDEPWAAAFIPGTEIIVVTEQGGRIVGNDIRNGRALFFTGVPEVDYGGQGGLGDIAFLPSEAADTLTPRTIYLSWAEAGSGDTRGAVVGKGQIVCEEHQTCDIRGLQVIWRQPKVSGRGHYSHRITVSPDEQYLYVASGDRQKKDPAQDLSNNLGTIVRLTMDGKPAAGNPFAARSGASGDIWTYGHRNILGMQFDDQNRLWDLEHGPAGGDELNLVKQGQNYGWPIVSNGNDYNGANIPDHSTRPEFAAPAISWTPVIAPGNFIFYRGDLFDAWKGDAIIAGLKSEAIVRVSINGETASETGRYAMDSRIRQIVEGPDGAIWVLEDGENARLLKLTPR
ncbi:PQQ-dependent sugar dehydrogenase [Altererythrobacter aquiaggeris]|uniref:PQQ-dependent sugar dehydrogenase n=1 Tax=Aestuarierythrobacter aquiaggeris TaxID=1898396 RepID=UPI003017746A